MFISDNKKVSLVYSQSTLDFIEKYKKYETELILNKPEKKNLMGKIETIFSYLQQHYVSFSLFLGVIGFLLITNHLNNIIFIIMLYSAYHYIVNFFLRKERMRDVELNKIRRQIFFTENFLKNKKFIMEDLSKNEDSLGIISYYNNKDINQCLTESDMENIVDLLKIEIKNQKHIENLDLGNFVRKIMLKK